jgi:tight adherence protein C
MAAGKTLTIASLLPPGVAVEDLYMLLAAAASFLVVLSLGMTFTERDRLAPRLKAIHRRRDELKAGYLAPRKAATAAETPPDWMKRFVHRFDILKDSQITRLTTLLTQAGYRSKDAVILYAFSKTVMPFAGLALGLLLARIDWSDPFAVSKIGKWAIVILAGYAGAMLPDLLIRNLRGKRYQAVRLALPDMLDLMLICAEAGLSLAAALDRVAKELGQSYPEMAEEVSMTSVEIGFLPDRASALRNLARRVDIQEIRGMVNILLQTEKYGTPVGQAIRVLAKEFRDERMLRAEQKAAQLPALMTIPLILCILPTLFVVVLTPAIINILDAL